MVTPFGGGPTARPGIPEGKVIRRISGSADALKLLLLDLKKYSFSGYIRTIRVAQGAPSEGFIVLLSGAPEVALHFRGDSEDIGRTALKKAWQDSYDSSCSIELHAKIDVTELVKSLGRGAIERGKRAARKGQAGEKTGRENLEAKLARWVDAGYAVLDLETTLRRSPEEAEAAFATFEESLRRAGMLRGILRELDTRGFEVRVAEIEEKLRDTRNLPGAEALIEDLRQTIARVRREEQDRAQAEARELEVREQARDVLDTIVRHRKAAGRDTTDITESAVVTEIKEPPISRDERTNLIRPFTFDTFVVGPSNRFPHAACGAVAKSSHNSYNPLFITAGPGLGKTHLLNAIGNAILAAKPAATVRYLSVEGFANEFMDAQADGTMPEFRERYRTLDVLLLDDVHFLSGRGDVQEELFHTFNELYNSGKRIALASDRPPKQIPDLEDRLVSRFESGLVADVHPPDYETRIAILQKKVRDGGVGIEDDVLPYIANLVQSNVRELSGALNRVLAFSSLMEEALTLDMARDVLQHLEGSEARRDHVRIDSADIPPGTAYLVIEDRPAECFRLFARVAGNGSGGLVITRANPKRLRGRFHLDSVKIMWLTDREGDAGETVPPVLERIFYEIEDHMKKTSRGAVLIDGVEYLVSSNSFESVLKFLRNLVDHVSESRHTLLLSVGRGTLKEQELKVLEREMEVLAL